MPCDTKSEDREAQRRHHAVKMFRAGYKPTEIAIALQRSRRWVYDWIAYQRHHPHTRFRSASRAAHHHPNQLSRHLAHRIVQLRQTLVQQRNPRLRYAPIGARTIRRELHKHHVRPCPSVSTIQRVLRRNGLTQRATPEAPRAYRPHPLALYPNAVQATDIVTRWLTGGEVVQTFTTIDHFTNAASATAQASKQAGAARQHLLQTWQSLGLPDFTQFDNESAVSGGRHPRQLSPIVRLCLYVGSAVLFTPEYEADYNWAIETFNNFWAHQFWPNHRFTHRWQIPPALRRFLHWYNTDYVAPRQTAPPEQVRKGYRLYLLPPALAERIPAQVPLCQGWVHAVRRVSEAGYVKFLNEPFPVGKRYHARYLWLTLDTAEQTLTVSYQAQAQADWQTLKVFPYPLAEPVQPVLKQFACLHVDRAVCTMC